MLTGMHTEGFVTQDSANTDLQIFIGASEFNDINGVSALASAGAGLFTLNVPTNSNGKFFANIAAFLHRIGMYATPANTQEQFGTAASVPGPTTVANTSDAFGIQGIPPILASKLATLAGPAVGPVPKGMQINSFDVIYEVDGAALSAATVGLTKTTFSNNAAPVVTNIVALGANGLPTAANTAGQAAVTNVSVATPVMITDADCSLILNVVLTTPASTGTAKFYGVVVKMNFNLN